MLAPFWNVNMQFCHKNDVSFVHEHEGKHFADKYLRIHYMSQGKSSLLTYVNIVSMKLPVPAKITFQATKQHV